jgi:hypothetical protein
MKTTNSGQTTDHPNASEIEACRAAILRANTKAPTSAHARLWANQAKLAAARLETLGAC